MTEEQPASNRREGRGRLSSLDMLPEICHEDIVWANAELRERRMPQTEIFRQFNARIADHGVAPVSKSAFSRYSVRKAILFRKHDASDRITDAILRRVPLEDRSATLTAAVELLKYRVHDFIVDGEDPSGKDLQAASLALLRLASIEARAKEEKRKDEKHQREEEDRQKAAEEKLEQELAEEVGKIATEAGLGADRIAAIRKGVLGLNA